MGIFGHKNIQSSSVMFKHAKYDTGLDTKSELRI